MSTCQRMSAIVLFNQQRIRDRHKREALTEAFRRADKNGDGRLSVDEVYGIYIEHGVEITKEEVQKIVTEADKDGTGELTEQEFLDSRKTASIPTSMEEKGGDGGAGGGGGGHQKDHGKQAELAFKLYDKDKDGYITKSEMEKLSKNLTKEQIEKVFARFDADGDGRLSYAEFRKMMNK